MKVLLERFHSNGHTTDTKMLEHRRSFLNERALNDQGGSVDTKKAYRHSSKFRLQQIVQLIMMIL